MSNKLPELNREEITALERGYELTGEYRKPGHGDIWFSGTPRSGDILDGKFLEPRIILRRLEKPEAPAGFCLGPYRVPKKGESFLLEDGSVYWQAKEPTTETRRRWILESNSEQVPAPALAPDSPFLKDHKGHDFRPCDDTICGASGRHQCAKCGWIDYSYDRALSCADVFNSKLNKEPSFILKQVPVPSLPKPTAEQLNHRWKVVGYGPPKEGDRYWSVTGHVERRGPEDHVEGSRWILGEVSPQVWMRPTEEEIAGKAEVIGEFRFPVKGEYFFGANRTIAQFDGPANVDRSYADGSRWILRMLPKCEPPRQPDPAPQALSSATSATSTASLLAELRGARALSTATPQPKRRPTMAKLVGLALVAVLSAGTGAYYATPKPPEKVDFERSMNDLYLESFKVTHAKCEQEGHDFKLHDGWISDEWRCTRCGRRS